MICGKQVEAESLVPPRHQLSFCSSAPSATQHQSPNHDPPIASPTTPQVPPLPPNPHLRILCVPPASPSPSPLTLQLTPAPTSFCKCTCFSNSTIILLDAPASHASRSLHDFLPRTAQGDDVEELLPEDPPIATPPEGEGEGESSPEEGEGGGDNRKENGDRKEYRARNCNDCNRQFCLDYNLPICKGAGMEDVATTCFRKWNACMDGEREGKGFGLMFECYRA